MNENELQVFLEYLNLSGVEMPVHQNRLRSALVALGENRRTHRTSSWSAIRDRLTEVFRSRRLTLIGSGAALAVAAVLGLVVLNTQDSPYARAEGLVNHSIETMQALSPEVKAQLKKDFRRDPLEFLEEAKQANDLEIITKVEYEAELRKRGFGSFSIGDQTHTFALTVSKYLRYTNPSEKIVLLGMKENDALVFAITFTSEHRTDINIGEIENLD